MTGRRKLLLVIAAVLAVLVVVFLLVVKPRQGELNTVRASVQAEQDRTQQLQAELSRLQELQKRAPELEAEHSRLRRLVPEQNDVANFIFDVQEAANEAGVAFVTITPQLPESPPEGADVAQIRTMIGARGDYFAIQDFVRRLYSLSRAVRIDNLALTGPEGAGATTGTTTTGATTATTSASQDQISMEAIARIFFQLPAAGAPSATSVPAPATATTTGATPAPAPATAP